MKRFLLLLTAAVLTIVLAACSGDDKKDGDAKEASEKGNEVLVVGASNNPHAPILERIQPILAKEGIDLKNIYYPRDTDNLRQKLNIDRNKIIILLVILKKCVWICLCIY